ncbi:MAG: hypothetical protein ACT4PO_06680 [Actinomycetota bacterium]
MADFAIKKGDLEPAIKATLQDAAGAAVDLTGATVKFIMASLAATTPKILAAATITAATTGKVEYVWIGTDTDTDGRYRGEFEVTWASGKKQTFPSDGYVEIIVTEDLD